MIGQWRGAPLSMPGRQIPLTAGLNAGTNLVPGHEGPVW